MHELGLASDILKVALKEARDRKIISVKIAIAEDGHATRQTLSEAFRLVAQGTPAEGARLDIQESNCFETRVVELEVEGS